MWNAYAEYADGTVVDRNFPYAEDGIYSAECARQFDLEEWLVGLHEDFIFYSVSYIEDN